MNYQIPAATFENEYLVKKSRFIARLVRACSSATQQVLDLAPVQTVRELLSCTAIGDFSMEQALRHFLTGVDGELQGVNYTQAVTFDLVIPTVQFAALAEFCAAHAIELLLHDESTKAKLS